MFDLDINLLSFVEWPFEGDVQPFSTFNVVHGAGMSIVHFLPNDFDFNTPESITDRFVVVNKQWETG